jgi:cyclopropane fatty-acyl-phospholipid synthase-like methyltransferase
MHEQVYKGLQNNGFVSWDKEKDPENLWSHQINQSLKKLLDQEGINLQNLNVLDLGTGAGTCALFCAREGARSTGVDISKTAINMARANNDYFKLSAEFLEGDILNLKLNKKFDLITDSSLLHCLVGSDDRIKFYEAIKAHLSDSGLVFVHTMVSSNDMSSLLENDYLHLEGETLYSLGIEDINQGRILFEGKSYFPHRSILGVGNLLSEIQMAGLEVVSTTIVSNPGDPDNFIGLLRSN